MATLKSMLGLLLLLACIGSVHSQSNGGDLRVKGVFHNGGIYVRWIPTNYGIWQRGNANGYKVQRQLVALNGVAVDEATRLQSSYDFPLYFTPLPEGQWDMNDDVSAVASGALYSPNFEVVPGSDALSNAVNSNDVNENRITVLDVPDIETSVISLIETHAAICLNDPIELRFGLLQAVQGTIQHQWTNPIGTNVDDVVEKLKSFW
jgi:hypothetical protein